MRKTNAVRHNLPSKPPRKSFSDRSELASLFVRPGDLVCDLGAGAQQLRKFLPANTKYLAVDGVAALPGTHLADFETSDFTLPTEDFNVVMALGLFEHILNLEQFLGRLAKDCEDKFIIFSYDFWRSPKEKFEPAGQERRVRRICNLEDGIAIFSTYIQERSNGCHGYAAPCRFHRGAWHWWF